MPEPGATASPGPTAATLPEDPAGSPVDRLAARLEREPDLLPAGQPVLVALSGGPDSTALLHLLVHFAPVFGWKLTAAYYDHRLRSGGDARAAELRRRIEPLGVPLVTGRASERPDPSHAALRRLRYRWLRTAAERCGAGRIATAHHRDDQVETVLFRLLRGTGNRGLAGIPARRGPYVRPLLHERRAALEAWLDARGIEAFDDPANRDARYARTRLRETLLPALRRALGSDIDERLLGLADRARAVEAALEPVAARALAAFADGSWSDWPAELRAEALRLSARGDGVRLRAAAARVAAEAMPRVGSGHGLDVGGGLRLERSFDRWDLRAPRRRPPPDRTLRIESAAAGHGEARLGGRPWRLRWGPDLDEPARGTRVALSLSGGHYPLTIRAWSEGDRIRRVAGTRKVARLFRDARVPARERSTVPVVADRSGRVLCILAPGLADRIDRDARGDANIAIEVEDG